MYCKRFLLGAILVPFLCHTAQAQLSPVTQKVKKIQDACFTVDTHVDLPDYITEHPDFDVLQAHNFVSASSQVDLPNMQKGGLDGAFMSVYVGQGDRTPRGNDSARGLAMHLFDIIHTIANKYPDKFEIVTTPREALKAKKSHQKALFIGIENGWVIGDNLSLLKAYYELGARYMTLSHMKDNDICGSSTDSSQSGLTHFGEKVVAEMNRLGMMVDISHVSDSTFYDVIKLSKAPVIASHSACRALCSHPRNMTDDMLRALKKNGGVVQVNFVAEYIKDSVPNAAREKALDSLKSVYGSDLSKMEPARQAAFTAAVNGVYLAYPEGLANLHDVVDHIDHVVKTIGIDYVGIGADMDGGGGVPGCMSVGDYYHVTAELIARGYSKKDIKKIWSGNVFRVMDKCARVARQLNK